MDEYDKEHIKKGEKMKKGFVIASAGLAAALLMSTAAFAGTWELNSRQGWQYRQDDGSYARNGWSFINGVYYYFDENSYMLAGEATPDGYIVGANGAWLPDQTPADLSAGIYQAIQDISDYYGWDMRTNDYMTTETINSGNGLYLSLTNGSKSGSFQYSLEYGTGTLTKTAPGTYKAEIAADSDYTDFWVQKVTSSKDYIFVKSEGEGDGGWCDTITYRK